jgi:hypothetical protein
MYNEQTNALSLFILQLNKITQNKQMHTYLMGHAVAQWRGG